MKLLAAKAAEVGFGAVFMAERTFKRQYGDCRSQDNMNI
jgi:hypothetical protein